VHPSFTRNLNYCVHMTTHVPLIVGTLHCCIVSIKKMLLRYDQDSGSKAVDCNWHLEGSVNNSFSNVTCVFLRPIAKSLHGRGAASHWVRGA
jgi:hypothetical protein